MKEVPGLISKRNAEGEPWLEFVGDFEAKYKAEVDPWEQSGATGERAAYYSYSRKKLLTRLQARFNKKACGLEIGCGYGYLTRLLSQEFTISGLDVSETALKRASELNPGNEYIRADITGEGFALPDTYHFVILAECWWYVISEAKQTFHNCMSCLEPNGILVLHQCFEREQLALRDIADGFEGSLRLLMSYPGLRLLECHYDDTNTRCYNHGLVFCRKVGN